jgi:hypothetical protein
MSNDTEMKVKTLQTCEHPPLKYMALDYESKEAVLVVCEECCQTFGGGYVAFTASNGSHVVCTFDELGAPARFIMVPLSQLTLAGGEQQ